MISHPPIWKSVYVNRRPSQFQLLPVAGLLRPHDQFRQMPPVGCRQVLVAVEGRQERCVPLYKRLNGQRSIGGRGASVHCPQIKVPVLQSVGVGVRQQRLVISAALLPASSDVELFLLGHIDARYRVGTDGDGRIGQQPHGDVGPQSSLWAAVGVEPAEECGYLTLVEEIERHLGAWGEGTQSLHLVGDLIEKTSSLHLRPDALFRHRRGNRRHRWRRQGRGRRGHKWLKGGG